MKARRGPGIESVLVTAAQMQAIERGWFAAGLPVAALMEKAATAIADRIAARIAEGASVAILAGPGHNGGDALVVARELWLLGYTVSVFQPFERLKPLTQDHANFAAYLGMPILKEQTALAAAIEQSAAIVDGLFGFGQTRSISGPLVAAIELVNRAEALRLAIDIPTGLDSDTGEPIWDREKGEEPVVFRADVTLCLGLRKLGLVRDAALPYIGRVQLVPFGLRQADIQAALPDGTGHRRVTQAAAVAALGLPRSPLTHKYKEGHVLLVCGSRRYIGAALLAALGARASGVGMLSVIVPRSLKPSVAARLPEAVVIAADETPSGAIARLPQTLWDTKYDAIVCGCGLTTEGIQGLYLEGARQTEDNQCGPAFVVRHLLFGAPCPLILDADALNVLASLAPQDLAHRSAPTVLTPHPGEFRRLCGHQETHASLDTMRQTSMRYRATIVHKGARPAIVAPDRPVAIVDVGTPGLARGGSGDVLAGLMGGLVATAARQERDLFEAVAAATWWHAEGGRRAAAARSQLGVDGTTLVRFINRAIANCTGET